MLAVLSVIAGCGSNDPAATAGRSTDVAAPPVTVVDTAGTSTPSSALPATSGPSAASSPTSGTSPSAPATTTTAPFAPSDPAGTWAFVTPPVGFEPVVASDDGFGSLIVYSRGDGRHDPSDGPLSVRVTTGGSIDLGSPGSEATSVRGRPAVTGPLADDGRTYGSMVSFVDDLGRIVTVEWGELDQDVVGAARQLGPLDASTWATWRRALSIDSRVDHPEANADEVRIATDRGSLVALVPRDFPLIPSDQRRTCATLELDGARQQVTCGSHPEWIRVGDTTYLYGAADAGVGTITARPYPSGRSPADPTPISATVRIDPGWPNGVYVLVLGPDWCSVEVDGAGPDGIPAPAGPFPQPPDCRP